MPEHDPVLVTALCLWFAIFGACVGSFLNVFVYRFPRRESLVHPPSHCPRCGHLIRWYDNVPVFGWLRLGGKCRDCKLPISIRYPCVEAISGILFACLFVLFDYLLDVSLEGLSVLTLAGSTLGMIFLAAGLMFIDKMNRKTK